MEALSIWEKNLETKKEIRTNGLQKRMRLPSAVRTEYSLDIAEQVLKHPFFQCADTIYCYVPFREEVDTTLCIQTAWKQGKRVVVPRVCGTNQMEFYEIESMKELFPGYQGILEPAANRDRLFEASSCVHALMLVPGTNQMEFYEIESMKELFPGYQGILEPAANRDRLFEASSCVHALMLVPGVVFDRNGNRIGYGKGFYDYYLKTYPYISKIGLAFSCQCIEEIPAEPQDICMDVVLTESGDFMRG